MAEKIDMSLDDIIKLNKGRGGGGRGGAVRTAQGARGRGRGSGRGSNIRAFRGRVGGKKFGRGGYGAGISPLNRAGGNVRGRGALRGQGRGRGRGQGRGGAPFHVKKQQVNKRIQLARAILAKKKQQQRQQERQNLVFQNRGLQNSEMQAQGQTRRGRGRGRARGRINRNFGSMRSDFVTENTPRKRKWNNNNNNDDNGIIRISFANDSRSRSQDVSVTLPGQGQSGGRGAGRGRAGRGVGRGRAGRGQAGARGRGRGRGRGSPRAASIAGMVVTATGGSPGTPRRGLGRGGRIQLNRNPRGPYVQKVDPKIQEQIQNLRPSQSTSYQFNRQDFGRASTNVSLDDRFSSTPGFSGNVSPNASGRQVYM